MKNYLKANPAVIVVTAIFGAFLYYGIINSITMVIIGSVIAIVTVILSSIFDNINKNNRGNSAT